MPCSCNALQAAPTLQENTLHSCRLGKLLVTLFRCPPSGGLEVWAVWSLGRCPIHPRQNSEKPPRAPYRGTRLASTSPWKGTEAPGSLSRPSRPGKHHVQIHITSRIRLSIAGSLELCSRGRRASKGDSMLGTFPHKQAVQASSQCIRWGFGEQYLSIFTGIYVRA